MGRLMQLVNILLVLYCFYWTNKTLNTESQGCVWLIHINVMFHGYWSSSVIEHVMFLSREDKNLFNKSIILVNVLFILMQTFCWNVKCLCTYLFILEVLVSSAKANLTLQDVSKNTALHLACSKVSANLTLKNS